MKYLVLILALGLSGCDALKKSSAEMHACKSAPWEYEPGDLVKFKSTGETVRIIHQLNFCYDSKDRRREYNVLFPGDLTLNVRLEKIESL